MKIVAKIKVEAADAKDTDLADVNQMLAEQVAEQIVKSMTVDVILDRLTGVRTFTQTVHVLTEKEFEKLTMGDEEEQPVCGDGGCQIDGCCG